MNPFAQGILSPVGLDIGPAEVRAVQMRGSPGSAEVVAHAVFPRMGEPETGANITAEEARWIAEVLGRRGFQGSRVSVAAPAGSCSAHIIDLPSRDSGAPVATIARAEVARARRCAPDAFELATWYLPARGRAEQGLAVACERPRLEAWLDALEGGGLGVVGVDVEESALARGGSPAWAGEKDAIHVVLRIGWDTSLAVLVNAGTVVYTRRIEAGASTMVGRLRERANLSWSNAARVIKASTPDDPAPDVFEAHARTGWARLTERLGGDVDTAVTYVSHAYRGAEIGRVVVCGYGGHRPEVLKGLDECLGMPVVAGGADLTDGATSSRLVLAAALAGRFDE